MSTTSTSAAEDVTYRTAALTTGTAQDGERTVTMRAVAWDTPEPIGWGVVESFARGSITPYDPDQGILLRFEHTTTIGRVTSIQDTDDGALLTATIARTAAGDEAYQLVREGVITRCSIAFRTSASTRTVTERDDGTEEWVWTRAATTECSLVSFPAHPSSVVTQVRKDTTMDTDPTTRPAAPGPDPTTRAALDDLTRDVAALRARVEDTTRPAAVPLAYRSLGDYAHHLAAGDEDARRAYEGAVTGDAVTRPEWLGVLTTRMAAKQPVLNLFTHTYDLPAAGMTVEYGKHAASTVKVTRQAHEGDELAQGKTAMTTASAPVVTYGGVGAMSYQAVQRASVSLLDDLLSEQAVAYARQIEAAVRTEFERVVGVAESTPVASSALAASTPAWWLAAVLDIVDAYDDSPYALTGLAVSTDVFRHLAALKEERTALQITTAPENKIGTLTVSVPSAQLYGLTVTRVPSWAGNHAVAYDTAAIRCKESPGAPLRLQQDNILTITKNYAVYGYAAVFTPAEAALKALSLT